VSYDIWNWSAFHVARHRPPSRAEFVNFSKDLRTRLAGLRDTGWAPRVAAAEREAFERTIRSTGFPEFQIKERGPEGKLVRAADRAEYFPIVYSDPAEPNLAIMGYDIGSEPTRNAVIQRARETGRPAATPLLTLVNAGRPSPGFMSFIPVYDNPGPRAARRSSRKASFWGRFRPGR
jgi:CHASE1-domain containing sensor protein